MNDDFIKCCLASMMDQYTLIGKQLQKEKPDKDVIKQRLKKAETMIRLANEEILKGL